MYVQSHSISTIYFSELIDAKQNQGSVSMETKMKQPKQDPGPEQLQEQSLAKEGTQINRLSEVRVKESQEQYLVQISLQQMGQ